MLETNAGIASFLQIGRAVRPRPRLRSPAGRRHLAPSTLDEVRAAAAERPAPRARGAWPVGRAARAAGRAREHADPRRLLRRRLHADLPGAGLSGRRLPRVLCRGTTSPSTRSRSSARSRPRRRCSIPTAMSTIRRSSSTTRCGSSRTWAEREPASSGGARDLRRVVGLPPLRAVRGRARGAARAARVGAEDRPDLEHAAFPHGVSDALRARGSFLPRSRPPTTAT